MSLNKKFKENWLKILDFNAKIIEKKDFNKDLIKVRIPTTPLEINASLLNILVSKFYPNFVNDKEHVLDIIISNDKKIIKEIYLHLIDKNGNHYQVKKIERNIYTLKDQDLNNFEEIFNNFQNILREKEGITISGLRLYTEDAINLINSLINAIDTVDIKTYLNHLCHTFYKILGKDMFYIYPEPSFIIFFKKLLKFLNFIESSKIFTAIYGLFPKFNISITFALKELLFSILIEKSASNNKKNEIKIEDMYEFDINILEEPEIDYDLKEINPKEFLKKLNRKYNLNNSYYFNLEQFLNYINDLIESDFPLNQGRFSLLLQKLLYGYKSYEINWYSYPRPIVYNFFVKFFSRLVGFNINLKKISYWAIPELFINIFNSLWGLSNKIVILLTDVESISRDKRNNHPFLKEAFSNAYLLEFFNGKLTKIQLLDKSDIFIDNQLNSLEIIRNRLSSKLGYISSVFSIDKHLINLIIKNFLFNMSRFNPFSKLKTLKKFKNPIFFNIYPNISLFQKLKIRKLLPIIIDKFEF